MACWLAFDPQNLALETLKKVKSNRSESSAGVGYINTRSHNSTQSPKIRSRQNGSKQSEIVLNKVALQLIFLKKSTPFPFAIKTWYYIRSYLLQNTVGLPRIKSNICSYPIASKLQENIR